MSLESENEELKTRIFQVEHMNGMLDAQIQQLHEDVRVLTEKLRVALILNDQLNARITELQAKEQAFSEKGRWFGYKSADQNVRGAFDMLLVSGWISKRSRLAWKTTVYAGFGAHELGDEQTKEFWAKFEKYLNRE